METLESFQQNQRVIEDFTARTLASIPSDFGRLYYVGGLRDPSDGRYHHEGLAAIYPLGAVQQALEHCHKELFCRILESPLDRQEWDLRSCLAALSRDRSKIIAEWSENKTYLCLVPEGLPEYLTKLFQSNLQVLLEIIAAEAVSLPEVA